MKLDFKQEYQVDNNGYPVDLPDLDSFICPPYIMPYLEQNGVSIQYPQEGTLDPPHRWAIEYWILLNSHFATFHDSPQGDEDQIVSMANDECEILFKAFIEKVHASEHYSFTIADYQAKLWVESTKGMVWAAFRNNTLSTDSMDRRRGTSGLLVAMVFKLDELYDSFSESDPDSPYTAVDEHIMYNLWGEGYRHKYDSIQGKEFLTTYDKALVDVKENKRLFYGEMERQIREATEEGSDNAFNTKVESLCQYLEELFYYYLRHLRKTRIPDRMVINYLCNHWKDVTIATIHRAFYILSAGFAVEVSKGNLSCLSPCVDGDELYAHEKRARIVERATSAVCSVCEEYINKDDTLPWTAKLNSLGIDYDHLFIAMKDRYFSAVSLESFKYSIREADFSEIIARAKEKGTRSGMIGVIYFMISELGDNLGREWLLKAAESVTNKRGESAVATIRSHSKTDSQKEFEALLKKYITKYSPRKKRVRNTQ